MHRSRPLVFVIVAAAAACSKRDPAEGNDILAQDRTLAAHLETNRDTKRPTVPDACGAVTLAAAPSAANQQRAVELTQQAGVAEMHGDIQDAQLLLRRAASLDGTNKSAAYHLGRTSEALGDRTTAMNAYCHYLALAPTATESVEARQRVADLARSTPRASGSASTGVATHHNAAAATPRAPMRSASSIRPRAVASAPVQQAEPTPAPAPVTQAASESTSGEVAAAPAPAPPVEQPPAAPRTQRRSTMGAQSTIIGVAAGAILGAATGRSVKSTVIGAAAGGVLGTVVGSTTRPSPRGTRSFE